MLIQRKAALLRGKSALPAESRTCRSCHRRRRNNGGRNAVNSHLAVVENWRDIAEAGRSVKWRRNVAIIPWVVGGRPGAMDELRVRLDNGTNGARRSTPSGTRPRRNAKLRARLCQPKHRDERQRRADHDFRFHGIAMLPYINAHELASCNSHSCSLCRNLGFAPRLRVRKVNGRLLQIASGFSGQAAERADPDFYQSSRFKVMACRKRSGLELSSQKHDLQCSDSWSGRRLAEGLAHPP